MLKIALPLVRSVVLGLFACSLAFAADPVPPDWVNQPPLAKIKRWFRWQDVHDPGTQKMLAEAATAIAAFELEISTPDLRPRMGRTSVFAPGARERLRAPPIVERNGKTQDRRWIGRPYAFTALDPRRLAFLSYITDAGNPTRGYIEGFVFEQQEDGSWLFACHLSGYPRWIDTPKRVEREPYGTRVPADAKPEC